MGRLKLDRFSVIYRGIVNGPPRKKEGDILLGDVLEQWSLDGSVIRTNHLRWGDSSTSYTGQPNCYRTSEPANANYVRQDLSGGTIGGLHTYFTNVTGGISNKYDPLIPRELLE